MFVLLVVKHFLNVVLKITGYNTYIMQKGLAISPYHKDMSGPPNLQILLLAISTILSMIKLILRRNGRD